MEQLRKLQVEKVDAKQYYSRLTDIFRVYVFEKKGIHSLQNTTHDLVAQLRSLNMPKDQFDQLARRDEELHALASRGRWRSLVIMILAFVPAPFLVMLTNDD